MANSEWGTDSQQYKKVLTYLSTTRRSLIHAIAQLPTDDVETHRALSAALHAVRDAVAKVDKARSQLSES